MNHKLEDERNDSFYTIIGEQKFGDQSHVLIRFKIPETSREKRRRILDRVMEETGADALVECYWTKGSIIHKNQWSFDAILIFEWATRKHH